MTGTGIVIKEIALPYQISNTDSVSIVLQEMGASEIGMEDFCHIKGNTKLTLIVSIQLKKLIALAQLKKNYRKN